MAGISVGRDFLNNPKSSQTAKSREGASRAPSQLLLQFRLSGPGQQAFPVSHPDPFPLPIHRLDFVPRRQLCPVDTDKPPVQLRFLFV